MVFSKGHFGARPAKPPMKAKPMASHASAPKEVMMPHEGGTMKHASETHGTKPHPMTGVHAAMITHHEGGKAKTHTHHDGGEVETRDHMNLQEAHQHAQDALPPQEGTGEEDNEPVEASNDDSGGSAELDGAGSFS